MTKQTGYPHAEPVGDANISFANPEAKKTVPQTVYNVCLKQGCNHSWYALICRDTASEDAAMLCTERDYPVEVTYRRTDINGSISYDTYICCDREDLLQTLDWLGTCGFIPCQVWNFDIDKDIEPALHKLFNEAYNHRLQKIQKSANDMYADIDMQEVLSHATEHLEGDSQPAFRSLNEQIETASSRATEANTDTKPKEMYKDNNHFPF